MQVLLIQMLKKHAMRHIILIFCTIALFPTPVLATMWDADCERDLSFAAAISISGFNRQFVTNGSFDESYPRYLAIRYAPCVDAVAIEAERYDWVRHPNSRVPFMTEFYKTRDLLKGDPADIYALAKTYQTDGPELDRLLRSLFLHWAAEREYAPAQFEVLKGLIEHDSITNGTTINRIALVAAEGYIPAMLFVAQNFLTGEHVQENLGLAYYWLRRAKNANTDIANITKEPLEQLWIRLSAQDKKFFSRAERAYGVVTP